MGNFVLERKKKKKKKKRKKRKGLGWGNPSYYGASLAGDSAGFSDGGGGDGGGMGENKLRSYVQGIILEIISKK